MSGVKVVATCMQFYWRACCFLAEKFLPPAFAVYKYTKCSQFFPRDDRCALSAGGAYRETRHPLARVQMRMQFDTEKLAPQPQPRLAHWPTSSLFRKCVPHLCHGNAKPRYKRTARCSLSLHLRRFRGSVIRSVMGVVSQFRLRCATTPDCNYVNGRRYTRPWLT